MIDTLKEVIEENWLWRQQIFNLAKIDVRKTCRGAVLGWVWLFVKPLIYIAVFWFALEMGLRAGSDTAEYPYLLWLTAGLVPWFFMQSMISTGANVYKRYPFLVNKIHFPLSAISTFYVLAEFFVYLALMLLVVVVCFATGVSLSIYALQLIPIALVMLAFWTCFSIALSPLSAISKDFSNLLKAFSTPIFWVSGIIFDVFSLPLPWLTQALAFNPVTFFATASRAALCDKYWLWERPELLIPFLVVFLATATVMLLSYKKLRREVADVL